MPALIDMYDNSDAGNSVCEALITLTHRSWCAGIGDPPAERQRWRRWWKEHAGGVNIYGLDNCPDPRASSPPIDP